jgi:decaprenylphospho-beta-D-erythro-pentofuranosid-2-ulose 2-reductase
MEVARGHPQNAIVLGGSSDIARALTKKLCAAGTHTVVLAGRNRALLDAAALEAQEYGATRTATVLFDANEPADAARAVTECFERLGEPADLVIVAVGLLPDQLAVEDDAAAVTRVMNVNLTWPVSALAEVRRRLVAQRHGRILVMSSAAAVRIRRVAYLYGGAKIGLDRTCIGLAQSLEGTGVRLQLLRPAVVRTKMTSGLPEPPFTTGPNEVASNAMRGLATDHLVIWSPPALGWIFAILRLLPTRLFRVLADR